MHYEKEGKNAANNVAKQMLCDAKCRVLISSVVFHCFSVGPVASADDPSCSLMFNNALDNSNIFR